MYQKEVFLNDIYKLTKLNKKIAFTNGCFDILHIGHIDFLIKCKSLCDLLIVGINSDSSIKTIKGSNRPFNNIHKRKLYLSILECVDYFIEFDEDTPINLIKCINPDILIKGGDYSFHNIIGCDHVISNGGMVFTIPFEFNISSTKILNNCL